MMFAGNSTVIQQHTLKTPPHIRERFVSLQPEILDSLQSLIKIPSQAGLNSIDSILEKVEQLARGLSLELRPVVFEGKSCGLMLTLDGKIPGKHYCLNACLDTAPIGELTSWRIPPFNAELHEGWLYGRGSADSKAAATIFLHIMHTLSEEPFRLKGKLSLLLDADEHSGQFGGIKGFLSANTDLQGALIGYPGNTSIGIGARGFFRSEIVINGRQSHTGATSNRGVNAIHDGMALASELKSVIEATVSDSVFNVTQINGGQSFSVVPDTCTIKFDIRMPPGVKNGVIEQLVRETITRFDSSRAVNPSLLETSNAWDGYELPKNSMLRTALENAVAQLGMKVQSRVVGPSNIGNLLAAHGVEATCGFGVNYENIHAANERIEVNSLIPTGIAYLETIFSLMS